MPQVNDTNLKVQVYASGFEFATGMNFLGPDDILVIEKNTGKVKEIKNGTISGTVLDVSVANKSERGLLGIASSTYSIPNDDERAISKYVFLYYTESNKESNDICPEYYICEPGNDPSGNRMYRYELEGNKLVNPELFLDLPATPSPTHNGGIIEIGSDNYVYVTIGDLLGHLNESTSTKAQNFRNGTDPDGRSGILRITQDGKTVGAGLLGQYDPLNKYYAYGIRNSFGMDFDPLTGNLWDTENGPEYGDEINLVKPGFNSGWSQIQGIWRPSLGVWGQDFIAGMKLSNPEKDLVDFGGNGKYSPPEFTWKNPVGPTTLKFLSTDKLGKQYENDMLVADIKGRIYHFKLEENRTALSLKGVLADTIADRDEELQNIVLAHGFGRITDLEVGPDGYLYILSEYNHSPAIFRIVPSTISN